MTMAAGAHVSNQELQELVKAVYRDPVQDAPRLVYADALLEARSPRGEFINLQFVKDPTPRQISRMQQLLERSWKSWLGGLGDFTGFKGLRFGRGFVERIRLLRNVEALKRAHTLAEWATVREIELWRGAAPVDSFYCGDPAFHRVERWERARPAQLKRILRTPSHTRHISGIVDAGNLVDDFTESPLELDALELEGRWIGGRWLDRLLEAPLVRFATTLQLPVPARDIPRSIFKLQERPMKEVTFLMCHNYWVPELSLTYRREHVGDRWVLGVGRGSVRPDPTIRDRLADVLHSGPRPLRIEVARGVKIDVGGLAANLGIQIASA